MSTSLDLKKINKHVVRDGSILSNSYDESDISREGNENVLTGCYENEPQYTEFERKEMKTTDPGSDSCSEEEVDSGRLENLHWHTCEKCVILLHRDRSRCLD